MNPIYEDIWHKVLVESDRCRLHANAGRNDEALTLVYDA